MFRSVIRFMCGHMLQGPMNWVSGLSAWTLLAIFGIGGLTLVRLIDAPVSSTGRPVDGGDVVAHAADFPGACHRYGPLSYRGAGYYWECYGGIVRPDGTVTEFEALARLDTPLDVLYYRHGGILPYVTRLLMRA